MTMNDKDTALRAALDDAAATLAAVRATSRTDEWPEAGEHFFAICGDTLHVIRAALAQAPGGEGENERRSTWLIEQGREWAKEMRRSAAAMRTIHEDKIANGNDDIATVLEGFVEHLSAIYPRGAA